MVTEIVSKSSAYAIEGSFIYGHSTFLSYFQPFTSVLMVEIHEYDNLNKLLLGV